MFNENQYVLHKYFILLCYFFLSFLILLLTIRCFFFHKILTTFVKFSSICMNLVVLFPIKDITYASIVKTYLKIFDFSS